MQKLIWKNSKNEEINLTSGNFGITNWEGFSNTELNVQSQQVPFNDGSVYLDSLFSERELSVILAIDDEGSLEKRYELRRDLIEILNPKLGEGFLIYTNDFTSKRIKCISRLPIFENHNSNDSGSYKASLSWTACQPYWEDLEETTVQIHINSRPEIVNNGDVPAQVEIDWNGENIKNPWIKNITTGSFIRGEGVFNDGLIINTNVGNKKAIGKDLEFNYNFGGYIFNSSDNRDITVILGNTIILAGTDGINWDLVYSEEGVLFNEISYSEKHNMFIVSGNKDTIGIILTSKDGKTWEKQEFENKHFSEVSYFEDTEKFIICATNEFLISENGIDWESQANSFYKSYSLIRADGKYYGISESQNYEYSIIKSSDGTTWTSTALSSGREGYQIIYSKRLNVFLLLIQEENNGVILRSVDGTTWETSYTLEDNLINNVCWFDQFELFIAVGGFTQPGIILKSNNGISWEKDDETAPALLLSINYSKQQGQFLALGPSLIMTSINAENWNVNGGNASNVYGSICYSEKLDMYIATGEYGWMGISNDGIHWRFGYSGIECDMLKIIYSEEKECFISVGEHSLIIKSTDGETWTEVNQYVSGNGINFCDVIYSKKRGMFVAIGNYNGPHILTSTDGETWTEVSTNLQYDVGCISYSENEDLFVIESGIKIYKSDDLENWTLLYSVIDANAVSVGCSYSEDKKIFIFIYKSTHSSESARGHIIIVDTINNIFRDVRTLPENKDLSGIIYSPTLEFFIIITEKGNILRSVDGSEWSVENSNIKVGWYGGCFSIPHNRFMIVGEYGIILDSDFVEKENVINRLSKNSDMNFNLQKGSNILSIYYDSGTANAILRYRQKYVGV